MLVDVLKVHPDMVRWAVKAVIVLILERVFWVIDVPLKVSSGSLRIVNSIDTHIFVDLHAPVPAYIWMKIISV